MLYVIIGHDAPEAREKRPQVRPAHLAHLDPLARAGRIRLAGPFLDRTGSLIVLEADSLGERARRAPAGPGAPGAPAAPAGASRAPRARRGR